MKNFIVLLLILISLGASAQSPFKKLPKPEVKRGAFGQTAAVNPLKSAFRFTGPFAGYMYPQKQVVTGIGYGWQRLRYIDSTQKYYTEFSLSAAVYAGGNTIPSINPNNIISVGLSAGFLNQLIMLGGAYNLPTDDKPKGSWGLTFNFSVPLNN